MIWVNTIVFHITQLPQKADNCCYSATVECRVHLRFLYAHAESYHRYSRERTPFFARSFPFIFWALWHRRLRAHADSFVVKKKREEGRRERKRKKDKATISCLQFIKNESFDQLPIFSAMRCCLEIRISRRLLHVVTMLLQKCLIHGTAFHDFQLARRKICFASVTN